MIKQFIEMIKDEIPSIGLGIISHNTNIKGNITVSIHGYNFSAFMSYEGNYYILNNILDNDEWEVVITNSNDNKDKYYFDFRNKDLEVCFNILREHGI